MSEIARHQLLITLVHGTWGRGFFPKEYRARRRWLGLLSPAPPPWFHENSLFCNRLKTQLENENIAATFRAFQWSGTNSVFHRARAADELSSLLASDPDNANSIVIAHSHGGNLAFRAISKLGGRGATIHLITLATPFLRAFPTWSGPSFRDVVPYLYVATGWALLPIMTLPLEAYPRWAIIVAGLIAFVMTFVAASLLVLLIVNPPPTSVTWFGTWLNRQTKTWARRPFILAEAVNYDSVGPAAPNLLVIRGVDDEAALALAFGSIATAINRFVLRAMWKWINLLIIPLGIGVLVESFVRSGLDPDLFFERIFGDNPGTPVLILFLGLGVAMVSTFILLLVPALFNGRFGREFLIGAIRCEIATDSTPDSVRARIITLETPYQPLVPNTSIRPTWRTALSPQDFSLRMRHKIYDHPDCVPGIVKWIKEHIR
jgi:hypothetical protein